MRSFVQQTNKIIQLVPPPRALKENIIGFNFGIRPYRKGGIRLESNKHKDKIFYHNYGHGGAGVSLAYGCAKFIIERFKNSPSFQETKKVAVIGCGYMGLMEANILADLGLDVTLYTKEVPKELGIYDTESCITSQVAGGLWMPFGLEIPDKQIHFSLGKLSYDYYKECIEKDKYKGISEKSVFVIDAPNPIIEFCPPDLIKYEQVSIDFGNKKLHEALHYRSFLIDGDLFLRELYEEAQSKGVNFKIRSLENQQDVLDLDEKSIFNCTGSSSRYLFNDDNIVPIVGHILYLTKKSGVDYFLSAGIKNGATRVTAYPQNNKLAIGLTYEERGWLDQPDPESVKQLIENIDQFLYERVGLQSN